MTKDEIIGLFRQHECPLDRDDVWTVQQAIVVKHKALERLAGVLRISWDPPQIIRAERDEAVILAVGRLPEGPSEWSIGECLQTSGSTPGNYRVTGKQSPYVYAMAEKRSKDRVILKLAGLHGAYSEDEADDFKHPGYEEREERAAPQQASNDGAIGPSVAAQRMAREFRECRSADDIDRLKRTDEFRAFWNQASKVDQEFVKEAASAAAARLIQRSAA